MKITKKELFTFILQVCFVLILLTSFVYWGESKNKSLSITVTVEPVRTIVVDRNLQITNVISNTKEDVRPVVVLDTRDGPDLPYTESIEKQYAALKPIINFSKPGVVYERDTRVTLAVLKTLISLLEKLLHISY